MNLLSVGNLTNQFDHHPRQVPAKSLDIFLVVTMQLSRNFRPDEDNGCGVLSNRLFQSP